MKTLPGWRDAERSLRAAADRYGSLAGWAAERWWPLHWDTDPMVKVLDDAMRRCAPTTLLGRMTQDELEQAISHRTPQRAVTRCLESKIDDAPMAALVVRRLRVLAPTAWLADPRREVEALRRATVAMLRPNHALTILRCILNGWPTSARMGAEVRRSCVFGCAGEDDTLRHYLQCVVLWTHVAAVTGAPATLRAAARLGLAEAYAPCEAIPPLLLAAGVFTTLVFGDASIADAARRAVRAPQADSDAGRLHELVNDVWRSVSAFIGGPPEPPARAAGGGGRAARGRRREGARRMEQRRDVVRA